MIICGNVRIYLLWYAPPAKCVAPADSDAHRKSKVHTSTLLEEEREEVRGGRREKRALTFHSISLEEQGSGEREVACLSHTYLEFCNVQLLVFTANC